MTASTPLPGIEAQNFFKVLSLIDRTILARRLVLSGGAGDLVLIAARQCVSLEERSGALHRSLEHVAAAIVRYCATPRPVGCRVEAFSPAASAPAGYTAVEIVNAQGGGEAGTDAHGMKQYRFTVTGWPLAIPLGASFASLEAAARIAWMMSRWQGKHGGKLSPPMLMLAVSDGLAEGLSVAVEGSLTLTATPPAQLGLLVSRWRSRAGDGGPA